MGIAAKFMQSFAAAHTHGPSQIRHACTRSIRAGSYAHPPHYMYNVGAQYSERAGIYTTTGGVQVVWRGQRGWPCQTRVQVHVLSHLQSD